jgi:hypothetical protein
MAKWTLFPDEWYPVMQLNRYREKHPSYKEAEFSDEEIAELRELEVKFAGWQRKIAERFELPLDHPTVFTLVYDERGGSISLTSTRKAGRSE